MRTNRESVNFELTPDDIKLYNFIIQKLMECYYQMGVNHTVWKFPISGKNHPSAEKAAVSLAILQEDSEYAHLSSKEHFFCIVKFPGKLFFPSNGLKNLLGLQGLTIRLDEQTSGLIIDGIIPVSTTGLFFQ